MKKRRKIVITAGPTREYIDPVRYISNDSSGRMGFAIAAAAARLGMDAMLIAGPVSIETPKSVRRMNVISAKEMLSAVTKHAAKSDLIIMCAAVADFSPEKISRKKIKKEDGGSSKITLKLKKNPDILAEICKNKKSGQVVVGFALETEKLEKNAISKLRRKGCDWIVANSASAIGSDKNSAVMISRDGKKIRLPKMDKNDLAVLLLSHLMCA